MLTPLGIVVQGKVEGLDIKYEMTNETYLDFQRRALKSQEEINNLTRAISGNGRKTKKYKDMDIDKTLKIIEFSDLKINKHKEFSFVIRNMSGIDTNFELKLKNYLAGKLPVKQKSKDFVVTNASSSFILNSV